MRFALTQAQDALRNHDFPVGAVLVIDGEVIGGDHNRIVSTKSLVAHAENALLIAHATMLAHARGREVALYTTLEPCMMCMATAVHSHISKIIYACADAHGGSTKCPFDSGWYREQWPIVVHDQQFERAVAYMLLKFVKHRPHLEPRFETLAKKFPDLGARPFEEPF